TVRFDARALDVTAAKTPTADATAPTAPSSVTPARRDVLFFSAGLLFVLYSLLVAFKSREVERSTKAAGAIARPLIPLPMYVRAIAAGAALVGGLSLQLFLRTGTLGALFVAIAAALSMFRAPEVPSASRLRGPGAWLPISEEEAFARLPRRTGTYLDVSTRAGKALLLSTLGLLGAAVYFVSERSLYHAYLLGFDVVTILAIFCTGRQSDIPLDAVSYAKPFLQDVTKRLRKALRKSGEEVRIIPRIRLPEGSAVADEMRLVIVPRSPLTGFVGLEIGVVSIPSAQSAVHHPEVIVRVAAGSPCEEALATVLEQGKNQRGRRSSERAIAFSPRLPTTWMTTDLALGLLAALRQARKGDERSGIRRTSQLREERAARVA
ncbi:MAG TPA: hypothetical protein PKA58_29000, partial [Polyangium sp.]|nr:hypothetical protein [Polyangium sp.]